MKLLDKIAIAGAVDSGRGRIALMLSEITGLPIISYEHADLYRDEANLRGIVFDVGSDHRADRVRELGFKVIRYTNQDCGKRVSIPLEDGDIVLDVLASDTPRDVYKKLVKIFEESLVIRDVVETTGSEDD